MTHWYSVPRLVSIGIRVAVSTIFGEFADRRATFAMERPLDAGAMDPAHVYPGDADENFWLDFAADNGDGWDSTYAIARLLAAAQLDPAGNPHGELRRARVLVLGGDQVYPTPSDQDYRDKFVTPFVEASRTDPQLEQDGPDLYAMPGNHDWYDGLSAFLNLFCWRQRAGSWSIGRDGHRIGAWRTQQTRSYFALELPHDWWLWGTDIQLTRYIDQAQIDFFEHAARHWMPANARLILCASVPDWVYADPKHPHRTFEHFSYIEGILYRVGRGQRLAVVLTGDSHHYSHYTEDDRHYITAGGGGAFLHPTHQLRDRNTFPWPWPRPNPHVGPPPAPVHPGQASRPAGERSFTVAEKPDGKPAIFPSAGTSRWLSLRNVAFAILNWDFAAAVAVVCAVFAWQLDGVARSAGRDLPRVLTASPDLAGALWAYGALVFATPWPPLLVLAAAAGYCYFANFKTWPGRIAAGALHTLAQTIPVVLATIALARYAPYAESSLGLIAWTGAVGGLIAATVMGLYLLICLTLTGRHWDHAFSALRIRHYKNFLRLRIGPDGRLTIYPIGLEHVPRDRKVPPANPPLSPHLIEPPISVG